MIHSTALIVYIGSGDASHTKEICMAHGIRDDYVGLPNGDSVGIFHAKDMVARKELEALPNLTVMPPMHRPLQPNHIALLSYAGIVEGDTGWDAREKLFAHHGMPWFHPEEGPQSNSPAGS